jgi:hypothetical protein
MAIEPDTKDWTWVLHERCPECGEDVATIPGEDVPGLIRSTADAWAGVLLRDDVGERPSPDVWSPLEYACHVRDVFVLFDQRLALMLAQVDPLFVNWDQDATAVESRYDLQDPAEVTIELRHAADELASRFEAASAADWLRTGRRSDGAVFTVGTFSQYLLHDDLHHLHDVGAARPG